ncbi:MAG: aminotransferase class V-fold PLP-dependent enzyme [Bacteroidales bacterium]|nr:aminotransferase class V-fold PLP-dependent enzyme [Bacteroidales bacterium]
MDWKAVREEFPVCKKFVYLNPAGGSPVSFSAAAEGKRFYDEMLEGGDTYWDEWLERTEKVRENLSDFIGAEKNEIGLTTNTSTGMNFIAEMLKHEGEVLTMEDEFPSSTFPWINRGIKLNFVKPTLKGYTVDHIEKHITPGIRVLVSSHVQYRTGFRQNLMELGEMCKRKGLVFVVNATQSMGIFEIDVRLCNIDFLIFTGLKWATAGYGIAGLYINKNMLQKYKLPFAGWRSVEYPENMDNSILEIKNSASAIESGCPHFPNIFALGGALNLFNRIGKKNVEERVLYLNRYLEKKLLEKGFPVVPPVSEDNRSGILIVRTSDPKPIVEALFNKNIIVSARGEGLRISVNIFNNEEDIENLWKNCQD